MSEKRLCPECGDEREIKYFTAGGSTRRVCNRCNKRLNRQRFPEKAAREKQRYVEQCRERSYNLSPGEVSRMLEKQDGKCFVCGRGFSKENPFHVDHDHQTGSVRHLLCGGCNLRLGRIEAMLLCAENVVPLLRYLIVTDSPSIKQFPELLRKMFHVEQKV